MTCLAVHYTRYRLFGLVLLICGVGGASASRAVADDVRLALLRLMIFTDADWTDASRAAVTDSYDGKLTWTAWLACVGGRAHSRVD